MSLKTGIETAVHISHLHLKELHKVGLVQYRIALHYQVSNSGTKIYFIPCNIDNSAHQTNQRNNQPEMDDYSCWSQKYQVNYLNEPMPDKTTYYFKGYPDLTLLNQISLHITIELLFSESPKAKPRTLHSFTAKIRHLSGIFEYLPCTFDSYGTLSMAGAYHSALMEYKFQKNEEESDFLKRKFPSLTAYLSSMTSNYRYGEIVGFYNFYREGLEEELRVIQERFNEYSKMLLNQTKKSAYSKLSQNKKIFGLISKLNEKQATLKTEEQVKLTELFLQDVLNIKALIYLNWNEFNELVKNNSDKIIKTMRQRYEERVRERLKTNIFSQTIKNHDWTFNRYGNNSKNHLQQVEIMKKVAQQEGDVWTSSFPIENQNFFQNSQESVKIFEDVYETSRQLQSKTVPSGHQHIIFLVHGFQAHRNDLIEFKLSLQARLKAKVHISCANVGKTEASLQEMGELLAVEVTKYLQIVKKPYKVSFIGHSMGGIIIRSAIPHLKHIQTSLHSYVSLCTPHLGYLYQSTTLVQAGLWFLNAFDKCNSILQLTMQDKKNLRDTFLFRLASNGSLDKFKKIAFICSSQDEYVAFSSARVQKDTSILNRQLKNQEQKDVICKMVDSMLGSVEASCISRIDVIFSIENSNFDSFIGRTGHIKFLCDPHFLKLFAVGLDHLLL